MKEAKRIGIPVSCHCDLGGDENNAVRRVIELGKKAGCHIHIAHVSTKKALQTIRGAKQKFKAGGFALTCEAMPHHLCLTEEDANKLGVKTWGRVNPPLRSEEDRQALIQALNDGTVDAIATDHAPHSAADKMAGAPGFSGFETAFASLYTELIRGGAMGLKRLSSLLSANPARLLGFGNSKRGLLLPDCAANLVMLDTEAAWIVEPEKFFSRGKNSPFAGRQLYGKILMTFHKGRVVFEN
jgi:dihydroorotase